MIQTTQTWKDYSVDNSNYHPLIVVIKNGNIVWTFDASNIKEGSLRFTDDITDLGDFNIGATPSNSFECDIINFDNTFPSPSVFKGCRANLYFFLERPEFGGTNAVVGQAIVGQAIVGTESTWTDYIKRGVYYLDPVNSVGRTVHLSGSDAMSLAEFNSANMSGFSFSGLTCYQAIKKMGFNLQHTFPNSDYVLPNVVCNEESNLANITKRTALGYIASLCGCYARHDNTGELRLERFEINEVPGTGYAYGDTVVITNATDSPVDSLEISIPLTQEGTGEPSPTNFRPFKAYSEVPIYNNDQVDVIELGAEICDGTVSIDGTTVSSYVYYHYETFATVGTTSQGYAYGRINVSTLPYTLTRLVGCDRYPIVSSASPVGCRYAGNYIYIYDERFTSLAVAQTILDENPVHVVYESSSVITHTYTPVEFRTHYGTNTIWSVGEINVTYSTTSLPYVTKVMQEPSMDYYPVTVTGVFVSGTEGSYSVKGSDGYYLFVENNPLITSPSIADEIATALNTAYNGLSVYPFSLSFIADPCLQSGDAVLVGYNGTTIKTIVTSFQYGLGQQSTLETSADVEEHSSAEALIASIPGTKLAIQDLYKGDVLKKIINLSADEVQINAEQMNINGVVSANNNFKVNLDGTIEAVNGVFSGTVNASSGTFTGTVNATSGTFSGSVNSSSGTIGGFSIESNNLHNGMTALGDTTHDGVYVGNDGIALGKGNFKVTSAGALTATGATFTNGTINCGSNFSVDASGNVTAHSLTSDNATITGGSIDITTTTASNDKIYLRFNNGSSQNSIAISPSGLGVSESGTDGSFNTAVNARGITVSNPSVGTGGTRYASILRPVTGNGVQMILCDYNGAERMVFDGTTTLGKLHFKNSGSNTISITPSSGNITCVSLTQTSDRRLKDNIKPLIDPITLKLKPVSFTLKDEEEGRVHHGFIAQDVEKIFDGMVYEEDGKKTLAYTEIIADLVATVQSLNKRIEELEKNNGIK